MEVSGKREVGVGGYVGRGVGGYHDCWKERF